MSLTLFFIVLSLAVGYLLYDTFKKSRIKTNKGSQTVSNRLKINYTNQCTVLNTLSEQKSSTIKTKIICLHLIGDPVQPSQQELLKCREVITKVINTRRVYLIQKKNENHNNLYKMIREVVGLQYIIPYNSLQGAVAILRQLLTGSGGIHLESSRQLYTKIKQYIQKIWLVGEDVDQQALREFKNEVQMIQFLSMLPQIKREQTK